MGRSLLVVVALLLFFAMIPTAQADFGAIRPYYQQTPPGFGLSTVVPSDVMVRMVWGSMVVSPSAIAHGNVTVITGTSGNVCQTGLLSHVYFDVPPVSGNTQEWGYSFMVTGGLCYRFSDNLDPNGANRITSYSYFDVVNESFEGQVHANATWCERSDAVSPAPTADSSCPSNRYANATWEGQAHANATWCPKVAGMCSGNFSGNFSGGNISGNFTLDNTTNVSIMGDVTFPAFDPYLPLLIWGLLMLLLLWLEAWAPAFVCFLNLMNSTLATPVLNFAASVLLFGLVLFLHSLIKWAWKRFFAVLPGSAPRS